MSTAPRDAAADEKVEPPKHGLRLLGNEAIEAAQLRTSEALYNFNNIAFNIQFKLFLVRKLEFTVEIYEQIALRPFTSTPKAKWLTLFILPSLPLGV